MREFMQTPVTEEQARKLEAFWQLLKEKNRVMNLTAITDDEAAAHLHFDDSLALLRAADPEGKRLIDVGAGAGFPGVPLAIVRPGADVTLLDSLQKRVDFLREACGLAGVRAECVHGRAEELGLDKKYRESFDIAVSRAVARLDMLCELCLPLVRPGGVFAAMKGSAAPEELAEAAAAIKKLGGSLREELAYTVPGGGERRLLIIEKTAPTPAGYPRRFSKIKQSPIR